MKPCRHARLPEISKGVWQTGKTCPKHDLGYLVVGQYRCKACLAYEPITPETLAEDSNGGGAE